MFGSSGENNSHWNVLAQKTDVDKVIQESRERPQLIYKHSSACGTSWFAKNELEHVMENLLETAEIHFVNVIHQRPVSNYIAEKLGVRHESPQVIIIFKGEVTWHVSHGGVNGTDVLSVLSNLRKAS